MSAPRVEIHYCTQCKFLMRASWLAQELLTTFDQDLGEVALVPGRGGIFEVTLDGEAVFSNREAGRFPEVREIKLALKERVAPERKIGHD
ncbi:MAG TPA: SelT/SelW/SelH family protein [Dehalococcoidia bacterium]|nr:SelT/SelW/SelH family protein [Dehalococcoidia bacterium]